MSEDTLCRLYVLCGEHRRGVLTRAAFLQYSADSFDRAGRVKPHQAKRRLLAKYRHEDGVIVHTAHEDL